MRPKLLFISRMHVHYAARVLHEPPAPRLRSWCSTRSTQHRSTKETEYLHRRYLRQQRTDCHATGRPLWHWSTLNWGKTACNQCGLYERTHLRRAAG
ncbi:unnamed protein product [Mycena citricolor]|uniref:GATA-type domain-containing protein n=1 Tax=Mycena citricolor TaxID=2018698 RepID=A0AAD2JV51_9AGAR|nr:unnamed protein product [Mycena citricolor]